jgi:hypothetical protein
MNAKFLLSILRRPHNADDIPAYEVKRAELLRAIAREEREAEARTPHLLQLHRAVDDAKLALLRHGKTPKVTYTNPEWNAARREYERVDLWLRVHQQSYTVKQPYGTPEDVITELKRRSRGGAAVPPPAKNNVLEVLQESLARNKHLAEAERLSIALIGAKAALREAKANTRTEPHSDLE